MYHCFVFILSNILGLTRLVGGQSALVGRLEMWNNGSWGTVCPNNYKAAGHYLNVSKVVCSSLGYDV